MLRRDTPFSWCETPRMRWRAYGVLAFLRELAANVIAASIMVVLIVAVLTVLRRSHLSWDAVPVFAGFAGFLGLILQLEPRFAQLREGWFRYGGYRSTDSWPIKSCRIIEMTSVRGVLRIELEVPLQRGEAGRDKTRLVVLARPKHAESIRHAFEAGGASVSLEQNGSGRER